MAETFYITTPLYYVNAAPHLGGTYSTIVCDTIARYKRMMGFDVKFLTGTDEHGQKIERSAREQGIEPKALADSVAAQYRDLWKSIGIRNDLWVRTTDPAHYKAVQEIYRRVRENGFIYKDEYTGWYCVSCEAYAPGERWRQARTLSRLRSRNGMVRRRKLLFQAVGVQGSPARLLRRTPRLCTSRIPSERGGFVCPRRTQGPLDQPGDTEVGRAVSR